jgi:hypothetical protein
MATGWPHPPAEPEPTRVAPQPAFIVRAAGLALLAAAALASALAVLRVSVWLLPVAVGLGFAGALAGWGALVQWVGGERVDDHPWV